MTPRSILIAARGLVAKGWTQGEFARDSRGGPVVVEDRAATCFCMSGAIRKVSDACAARVVVWNAVHDAIAATSCRDWNDAPGRTQDEVLAAFDRAIEAASEVSDGR